MLIVLTLGHMIPIVLNFEAFLQNYARQNVLLENGGWLKVNEMIVRVVTIPSPPQMTWSARSGDENQRAYGWLRSMSCMCLYHYTYLDA